VRYNVGRIHGVLTCKWVTGVCGRCLSLKSTMEADEAGF